MATIQVEAQRDIAAPAELVYRLIADHDRHHPYFLPPAFSDFQIESGGVGEGTVTRFKITAGGRTRSYHMDVTEPEPGRVMRESDRESSLVTTWTVEPQGSSARVHLQTTWEGAGGIGGFFERMFAPRVMRGLYQDELERLNQYARRQATAAG
jgi:uncharacterized protein YndB with AHSA1/START domain